jgi:hypothetical protein
LLPGARLRWDGHSPELDWEGDAIDFIARLLPSRLTAREVTLIDNPRKIGGVEGYQQPGSRMPGEWLVAYAAETAEGLRPTGLRLLGGRHPFIANARETMTSLLKHDVRLNLQEGLIGPWRYEDKGLQAWGWDADAGFSLLVQRVSNRLREGNLEPIVGAFGLRDDSELSRFGNGPNVVALPLPIDDAVVGLVLSVRDRLPGLRQVVSASNAME